MWARIFRGPGLEFTRTAPAAERFSWQPVAGVEVSLRRVAESPDNYDDRNQIRVWIRTKRGAYRLRQLEGRTELNTLGEDIASKRLESRDDPTAEVCPIVAPGADGLLFLRYQSEGNGANTVWNSTTEILIAVDQATPKVLGILKWDWNEGGGACGVWGNGEHEAAECEWDETEQDYACTESQLMFNAAWARDRNGTSARKLSRHFWLRTGRAVTDDRAISTEALWNALATEGPRSDEYILVGVGAVRLVTQVQTPAGPAFLIAAEGRTENLDARFLLVRKTRDGRFVRDTVPAFRVSTTSPGEAPRETVPAEYLAATSAEISVGAASHEGEASVWPVVVSRAGHSSLYWLGAEVIGDRVLTGSFFLSTDALVQENCGDLVLTDATVDARQVGPLAFNLLVQRGYVASHVAAEEPRQGSGEDDAGLEAHAWLRVAWAKGRGFVYSPPEVPRTRTRLPPLTPAPSPDFLTRPRWSTFVGAGNSSVAVDVMGRGRPVVFVWSGTGRSFFDRSTESEAPVPDDLRVAMEMLSAEFRVFSFQTAEGEPSPESMETVLRAFDIFELRGVTAVAVGDAHKLATSLARAHPERIRVLGLHNPSAAGGGSADKGRVRTLGPDLVEEVRRLAASPGTKVR